ncbi:MAG: cytochrome c biogenesis protein ResB [Lachnospiraceae bacterium]|nr:cytochrome c biogenesis protein ResB [Lachnospiraceae bacterium]
MKQLKRAGKFLCSMKCAIILLLILAAACTGGSLIPQGEITAYYTANYSEQIAGAIMLFGLDDIFHCWWFIILTLFLCVNLLCCNVLRFPSLIRRMKSGFSLEKCLKVWNGEAAVQIEGEPEAAFEKLGFRHAGKGLDASGRECRYASKNRIGIWGAWLCHLGMLIVIAGFGLGQMLQTEHTVYGVPGQTKPIEDTGYELTIDSFEVQLREDNTVEQYLAGVTVSDTKSGASKSGETSVNSPLSLFGMKFYQNSTGWAATLEVWKGEEKIQEELLCAGEYLEVEGMDGLAVLFRAFYPDYGTDETGSPMTHSPSLNNPGYLYALYYHDQVLGMNVLTGEDKITADDYTFIFRDPQQYTLIQIKRDPFSWLTAVGGLMVIISLLLAFYIHPAEIWAVKQDDGTWFVAGRDRKAGMLFQEEILEKSGGRAVPENGQKEVSDPERARDLKDGLGNGPVRKAGCPENDGSASREEEEQKNEQ